MGTHQQLVDQGGLYSQLWSAQETLFVGDESKDDVEGKEEREKKVKTLEGSIEGKK